MKEKFCKNGFSLIELAIVLVIIGLLVAGVLGGQTLINTSARNSLISDWERYSSAFISFKGKYNALPGDMSNATNFWPAANSNNATCLTTTRTFGTTCNGDGDENIRNYMTGYWLGHENGLAWEHLALSGLIKGGYSGYDSSSGTATGTARAAVIGITTPKTKFKDVGIGIYEKAMLNQSQGTGEAIWPGSYNHNLVIARYNNSDVSWAYLGRISLASSIETQDAYSIDAKADDGKPGMGKIKSFAGNLGGTCTTSTYNTYSEYQTVTYLKTSDIGCSLMFDIGI